MFVRGIGRRSVGTALQTSAITNMSSTYQELNFVPSYPALPYCRNLYICPPACQPACLRDAACLPPSCLYLCVPTPSSPSGVAAVFSGVMKAGAKKVVLAIDEVGPMDSTGAVAFERSHYTFYKEDGSTFDHGK